MKSGQFNPDWYLWQYPDVRLAGMDPALHYIRHGVHEGRYGRPFSDAHEAGPNGAEGALARHRKPWSIHLRSQHSTTSDITFERLPSPGRRYLAVFASYNVNGEILPYVVHYLRKLALVADIIFVSDNPVADAELSKIKALIIAAICDRHGEYDFGSYKRGYGYAEARGLIAKYEELILCNDSCVGPLHDLGDLLEEMRHSDFDFWGITHSDFVKYHLQSYFLVFRNNVFLHEKFRIFMRSIKPQDTVQKVILTYEVNFTKTLTDAGFRCCSVVNEKPIIPNPAQRRPISIEHHPLFTANNKSPFIKRKALLRAQCNQDGIDNTLAYLATSHSELADICLSEEKIAKYLTTGSVSFSIILPTRNRAYCVCGAIDSVLAQSHGNFELVIVDDGSTDGTEALLHERYAAQIATGRIKYIKNEENPGVCSARNSGVRNATKDWIVYVDSDNSIRRSFLKVFAQAIVEHPQTRTFYAEFCHLESGIIGGRPFDEDRIRSGNFVDLGVFVHHRDCVSALGGFDVELKRLVDWDLTIRYTAAYPPVFIPNVLMDYSNDENGDRISRRESELKARTLILHKHNFKPTVTTIIPCYNQQQYIAEAIESAASQKGDFHHEIVVSDDGSTDSTREIVDNYCRKHSSLIRSVGSTQNAGLTLNFRRCIAEAGGEHTAILEGDDYWTDDRKLEKQLTFLRENSDCSMVFSKLVVLNQTNGAKSTLKRQAEISKAKVDGRDFLADPSMNLIANFSSCMFRTHLLKALPDRLFTGRFNEIAIAFHLERHGSIGFINEALSVYRQHQAGLWTGSDRKSQLRSGLEVRQMVMDVARPEYRELIQRAIDTRLAELANL